MTFKKKSKKKYSKKAKILGDAKKNSVQSLDGVNKGKDGVSRWDLRADVNYQIFET